MEQRETWLPYKQTYFHVNICMVIRSDNTHCSALILIKSTRFIDRMLLVFMGKFEGGIYGTAGNMAVL
jgi:hypothetical protein